MNWREFCDCVTIMRNHFGKTIISDDRVSLGFKTWASRPKATLLVQINIAIETNTPFDLYEPEVNSKRPERTIYKSEKDYSTDGYLGRFLALKGCKSLAEVLEKEIAHQRTKNSTEI